MDLTKYHGKGYTGLVNLGNTCFLNSCIQALSHTYELSEILDSPKVRQHIKTENLESVILAEWNDLRAAMWQQNGIVSPNKFVHNIHRIATHKGKDIFTGWSQNDMPEFLLFMIECIHNSLARSVKIRIMGKTENSVDTLAVKCYEMLQESYSREYSEIMELFYGVYVSQISAIDCNQKPLSTKPESYFILDLPISGPHDVVGTIVPTHILPAESTNYVSVSNRSTPTIYDCFDLFIKPEVMMGENAWYNESTKTRENVKKQIVFWNFPKVLIITLKRFSPDGRQKMDGLIQFPLENLDLSRYIQGYNPSQYVYDLYAVCNHIGNIYMGHYTAFVKAANGEWLHYNDQSVEKISNPESVITPMAYCLFYRMKPKSA